MKILKMIEIINNYLRNVNFLSPNIYQYLWKTKY